MEQREAEAKLQAEKEEREVKLQERFKMEQMRTQLELAKIQAHASQQSEHNLTSSGTRPVHEGENCCSSSVDRTGGSSGDICLCGNGGD